jgi:hypothetical protein
MTPPLVTGPPGGCPCGCALTPDTSYGFDVIDFARDVCLTPFDPWQELAAIHLGELLPDGRPRFRTMLILVARQNGKSLLAKVLTLYWMFVESIRLILVTSSDRSYAKRAWQEIVNMAERNPTLRKHMPPEELGAEGYIVKSTGDESFHLRDSTPERAICSALVFAANNSRAGRSQTLRRWFCDELREHKNRLAWDAATGAMNAVADAQAVCVTNQGDDYAVVLDSLRDPALEYIETGVGDPRLGLLEWSAPDGAEPDDLEALAQANPNMNRPGHGPLGDSLLATAMRAKRAGGEELSSFVTEIMCRRVNLLNPAIEPALWDKAKAVEPLDLALHRDKVALCLDVSLSGDRADLVAAAEVDGVVHLDVVKTWSGPYCTKELRRELPAIVAKVKPRAIGWFPAGPAAVVAADLTKKRAGEGRAKWPPPRVKLVELTTETPAAAMSFAELVKVGEVRHPNDPSLNAQVANAQRLRMGDRWTFGRRGTGPVSGCYAAAGATWLARNLPPAPPPLVTATAPKQ